MSDKQIIVCHEKHGESYYDASTLEALHRSALAILTYRFNLGYVYYDPREDTHEFTLARRKERADLIAMTDEQIAAIPSDVARVELRKKRRAALQREREDERTAVEYERIKAAVENKDGAAAWELLCDRSDHEYERVELETLR